MARKRMIDPSIWADDSFGSLSRDAQVVFIGMISNADDEGILPGNALFIISTILPYESISKDRAINIRNEILQKMKSLAFYSVADKEYIQFKKWKFYQKVDKPQESKYPSFDDDSTINQEPVPPNRIEQNRIEKKRREEASPDFLKNLEENDIEDFKKTSSATKSQIKEKGLSLYDYCKAKGKKYSDYKALLRNALRKDYPLKEKVSLLGDLV